MSNTSETTALDFVKDGVELLVSLKATDVIKDQLSENTDLDVNRIPVRVGALLAGQIIGHTVRPFTDAAVDFAAANVKKAWNRTKRTKKTAE